MAFILYHGTTSESVASILENGLMPNIPLEGQGRKAIYLTDDREVAETYASYRCEGSGAIPIVIAINADFLSLQMLEPDDYDLQFHLDDLHDPRRIDDIGHRTGQRVDFHLAPFRRWQDVPAELSLLVTSQVAYTASIPVDAMINNNEIIDLLSNAYRPSPAGPRRVVK